MATRKVKSIIKRSKKYLLWLLILGAGYSIRPTIDFLYDVDKIRKSHYNDPRISKEGIKVLDEIATDWLIEKQKKGR